jgi:phosphatidylglycerol---prolipoprotein diacylglyceryl transferase
LRRILFRWCGIAIYAYPAMLYVGAVLGIVAGTFAASLRGLNPGRVYAAMLLLLLPAMVGARLLFVASHWDHYRGRLGAIWRRSDGGAALYGGLLTALVLSLPLVAALGIPVGGFWDTATVTILIGMTFTKIGCLLNGCCAGRPAQDAFALYLPNVHGVWCRRRPIQLVEAALAVVLLLGALAVWDRVPFDGAVFLAVLMAYGIARWGLESARESIDTVGAFSVHRMISVALVAFSLASFLLISLHGGAAR